jgi:hypothetical protein
MTKLEPDSIIALRGKEFKIVSILNDEAEETEDTEEACFIIYQEDGRYKMDPIEKGSLARMLAN